MFTKASGQIVLDSEAEWREHMARAWEEGADAGFQVGRHESNPPLNPYRAMTGPEAVVVLDD